ncbi:MAG: hypothetical protein FWD03_10370 [Defluviitaleaceae bacterium]|nr:hypothetical protein [Defluviitaleaceae bacterium]
MKKAPFYIVIVMILLLIVAMFTPRGAWILFAIIGTNSTDIIVVIATVLAIALIATFPYKKAIKTVRICLCLAVVFIAALMLARSIDYGGSLYGKWNLMRDAQVRGFNIADTPNFAIHFFEDGMLLKMDLDHDMVEELTWRTTTPGLNEILFIGGMPYEYRFSHFGNRLILELGGAERPRIPILTQPRDLEIVFRR